MSRRLVTLSLFAIAMACLEAAVVVYLRELYYPQDVRRIFPPEFMGELDFAVELTREAATMVMLLTVAVLAEPGGAARRFAAFVFLFGLWDIFYYVWLKLMIGWPVAWLEWDVLFLIPWIWLGPWICPALIALLFVVWGGWVLESGREPHFSRTNLALFLGGAATGLASFLQPAVPLLAEGGIEAMRGFVPGAFWWAVYWIGLALMTAGLAKAAREAQPVG